MEYYSAMKMNEVLIHATTWMDLEDISLSETCQTHKNTNTVMNPLKYLKQANSWRQKVQQKAPGAEEKEEAGYWLTSRVYVRDDEKVWADALHNVVNARNTSEARTCKCLKGEGFKSLKVKRSLEAIVNGSNV